MKTIISQDLKSWITPTPGQLLKVASDGEGFEWITDLSHDHSNKAILDQITANLVETITAGSNIAINRVGNSITIASSWGDGGGGYGIHIQLLLFEVFHLKQILQLVRHLSLALYCLSKLFPRL